jgi:hypothetical protein
MWIPLIYLYFTLGRGLPLAGSGIAVTAGSSVALVGNATLVWRVVDRLGPMRTKALAGLVAAPAFFGYLFTHNLIEIAVFAVLAASGDNLFFTADPEAVRRVSSNDEQRIHTFAVLATMRVIGFGAGAGLAALGLVVDAGAAWVWNALVVAVMAVQVFSSVVFWTLRGADDLWDGGSGGSAGEAEQPPRYLDVLRQKTFMVFMGGFFVVALVVTGADVCLPVYLVSLGLPKWSSTVCYLVLCVLIAVSAQVVARVAVRVGELRLLINGAIVFSACYLMAASLMLATRPVVMFAVLGVFLALWGTSEALTESLDSNVMLKFAPERSSGRHASVMTTGWAVAATFSPGIYATLFTWNRVLPWLVSAALVGITVVAYTHVRHTVERHAYTPSSPDIISKLPV